MEDLTVGRVAELAGVTIRTLHHYDRIGLLEPSGRSGAGYRHYGEADLKRLQQILLYRELGFRLEEITAILDDPGASPTEHLRTQREILKGRVARLESMIAAVELQMEAMKMGIELTPEERFEIFGNFDPEEHTREAEDRWGETDAFRESHERTRRYGAEEWRAIKAEAEDIEVGFAEALADGAPSDSERALELAERHRQHITRWFYDCTLEIHAGLGAMYVSDPRFREHYDSRAPGLAGFVSAAIAANARGRGA